MGYEIKLIIGRSTQQISKEIERDLEKPYKGLIGFEPKRDSDGNLIRTGRSLQWFCVDAEINLHKLGSQDDALNRLIADTQRKAKLCKDHAYYFYGIDGNIEQTSDKYGDRFLPVPVGEVLRAARASQRKSNPYRRLEWAIALLDATKDDGLEVIFYGH